MAQQTIGELFRQSLWTYISQGYEEIRRHYVVECDWINFQQLPKPVLQVGNPLAGLAAGSVKTDDAASVSALYLRIVWSVTAAALVLFLLLPYLRRLTKEQPH